MGPMRGERNEPMNIKLSAEFIAKIKGVGQGLGRYKKQKPKKKLVVIKNGKSDKIVGKLIIILSI